MGIINQPKSSTWLQKTKFQLQFTRLPNLVYFVQKFSLPGGEVKPVEQATPFKSRLAAGNKLEYESLNITFMVEEEMYTWENIHNWLKDIGTETSGQDYQNLKLFPGQAFKTNQNSYPDAYSTATLTRLDTQNNPKMRFHFEKCFPIKLGKIDFDTETSALDVPKCEITFGFFLYSIERF